MSSTCSFCYAKIEDGDKFCTGCGKVSFSYSRTHRTCTSCNETSSATLSRCPNCGFTNFHHEIYSLDSARLAGMDSESVFCDNCLNKVNRPVGEFTTNKNQNIRMNQVGSNWKKNRQGSKVAVCYVCQRDKGLMAKYSDQEKEYWENAPIQAVAIKKTTNFLKIALAVAVVLVIVIIVISVLVHNGSCVGPDGDYSNCYP